MQEKDVFDYRGGYDKPISVFEKKWGKEVDDNVIKPVCATKFKIFDAMCGEGKSTRIIKDMGRMDDESGGKQPFMYISPLRDECHRIAGTHYLEGDEKKRPVILDVESSGDQELNLYDYDQSHPLSKMMFKHPDYRGGTKSDNLKQLIKYKHNIVSTHQLFKQLTPDLLKQAGEYILVIDEALQCYDVFDGMTESVLDNFLKCKIMYVDDDGITLRFDRNSWGNQNAEVCGDRLKGSIYENLANLCDLGQLLYVSGKCVVWELSLETLFAFKEVWVATYLFEVSQMCAYFKGQGLEYELIQFGKKPSDFKHLINIYGMEDGISEYDKVKNCRTGINAIGWENTALSSTQIKNKKGDVVEVLRKNLYNFFNKKIKAKKGDRLWTSLKSLIKPVGEKRYQGDWLAFNTKATNNYGHVHNLAYLMNLYAQPFVVQASRMKGYPIDQDMYALSELVQWIWRSAIRNGEEINLYIPSSRMRNLLVQWLNDGYVDSIPHTEMKTIV